VVSQKSAGKADILKGSGILKHHYGADGGHRAAKAFLRGLQGPKARHRISNSRMPEVRLEMRQRDLAASYLTPPMAHIGSNSIKATILIVDDSPEIQRYLRALLELDSYKVETAANGDDALHSLRHACAPDLVLLDLQMPGMDGLETLRRLKELRPTPKVIMCSGVDDPAKIREAVSLGAHGYLVKPIQHLYLSAAVERCLAEVATKRPTEPAGAQVFVLPSPGRGERESVFGEFKS